MTQAPPPQTPLYENVSVVAAVATLIGVGLNIWFAQIRSKNELDAAEARQKAALEHAATEAATEREQTRDQAALERKHSADEARLDRLTAARREVYLSAVEELVKTQAFLGGLAKADIGKLDVQAGLNGFLVAVNRVACVADMATAMKAREISTWYGTTLLANFGKLLPMVALRSDVEVEERFYEGTQVEIKRILATMVQYNEARLNDPSAFAGLQASFERNQALAAEYNEKLYVARRAVTDAEMAFNAAAMGEMRAVAEKLDELLIMVRAELELETDAALFKQQTAEAFNRMNESIKRLFDQVNASRT